ncbi:hypothetical protein HBH56_118120 [Parastagonospora nodorum]|uniref:Uncharacterized protein n=1 Tax=Phaeosphaeria nodorum (strain SN15 / ATCC MYA-4574 / FGSC 10173) TaxID=321614 RepID=A0A7U2I8M1_PHANO|nr:hypothetical protein HBH56_118120 [Parastagonospora nodorum]QRD05259.1 hypothetical protein JI435_422190 [Parastagonospora nodorum SN15]KAH3928780.1 hypothetical protein HBH54_131090 [Parastagonospora nodorum]KAH3950513.1 hypothetical protein HBH53_071360 [Parastagonospora nodorum]KAH3959893.1 hypothetical protein HBH51_196530 [Parastagonospora nodorum]
MLACAKGSCRCSCVDPAWTRALWRCAGNYCESCLWWRGWGDDNVAYGLCTQQCFN